MDAIDWIAISAVCGSPILFGLLIGWLGDRLIARLDITS